ncbi:MAG: hypothetical protein J2P34_11470 [Actinobacteria bacterium]|nr:hypothetical protein [Actinomycetota bacterium]
MSVPARIVTLLVAFAAVVAGAVFVVIHYVGSNPPTVAYSASSGQVNVMLQEDPQNNTTDHPDWVSYYVQDPHSKQWVHTTLFSVPAHTRVNVTILGYDGCTPPRNNYWTQVQGTMGGTVTVQQFKNLGKPIGNPQTVSQIDGWAHCAVGHTFAIPSLHVYVPVASPNTALFNKEACGESPCTEGPFSKESFSFMTPSHPGYFRWQCFVPCGGGYLDGNGGPMQTIGYMMGQMEVTA